VPAEDIIIEEVTQSDIPNLEPMTIEAEEEEEAPPVWVRVVQ
jgi:hypothetical protein